MSEPILVVGATGSQGGAVADALLERGLPVRALTRNPGSEKAIRLAAAGAELAHGDLDSDADVCRAMTGVRGVYLVTDFFKNGLDKEVEHGERVIDIAAELGVGHLVLASVARCDQAGEVPHFATKWRLEQHLRARGVPATVLRPVIFMEDLTEKKYVPPAAWGTMTRVVGRDTPMHWIAVADIGRVAATAFAAPEAYIGRTLTLVGDVRSMAECRALFTAARGKKPLALPMPAWLFRTLVSKELHAMWRWIAAGGFDVEVAQTREFHPEVMDMTTWLAGKYPDAAAPRGRAAGA